jgi:hypothetical protein
MNTRSQFPRLQAKKGISAFKYQAGYLMLEMSLSLMLGLMAAVLAFWSTHRAELATQAMMQADNLSSVAKAAETLVLEHYDAYQAGLPITRNGVTLPFGTASGEALTPTLANLRAMAVGITPGSDFGSYKQLANATYITSIRREPAGCETSPNGRTCNITGLVCMDRPVSDLGAPATEIDGFGLGKMLGKIGGDGGASILGSTANITGGGGAWTAPNPFAGTPAGIVCARFGFGSAGFANFLRVNDSRDPNFLNNVTVGGNIIAPTGSIGTGTGTTGCRRGEIMASGDFISRSINCIKRAWVDGPNGEIGVADAAGTPRAQLKDTGEILSKDAAGVVKAGFTYVGLESNAKADRVETNAGTAGLRPNGESFANSVVINTSAAPGAACPTNDALVWGNGTNTLKLLKCVANLWTTTGATIGAVGGACTTNGEIGETPSKLSIICVGNVWQTTTSRMGSWAVSYTVYAINGSVLGKPACGSGGLPKLVEIPQAIDADKLYTSFSQTDNGSSWTVSLTDGAGNPTTSRALSQGGCWYN